MSKLLKLVLGAGAAAAIVVGALVAWVVLRDSAEDPASVAAIGTAAPSSESARETPDGTWSVQTGDGVFVGYRVHEKLRGLDKEVTGRTPEVSGTLTVAGNQITAVEVEADLTALSTDDPGRDQAVKRMGLTTNEFPTGTFRLTEPITLPAAPEAGKEVTVTATGDFTIHGVTRPVDVPLTARWDGDQIRVATAGQGVRVEFADYGFGALSVPVATTDDFGFFEVQLLFVPA